jgi:hypothetical protein
MLRELPCNAADAVAWPIHVCNCMATQCSWLLRFYQACSTGVIHGRFIVPVTRGKENGSAPRPSAEHLCAGVKTQTATYYTGIANSLQIT